MTNHSNVPTAPTSAPASANRVHDDMSDQEIGDLLDRAQQQLYQASTYIPHGLYRPEQWGYLANTCQQLGAIEPIIRRRAQSAVQWSRP